jgi:hypothetical protein
MIFVKPWTQFFDLKGREEVPLSYCDNITMRNIEFECDVFYDMKITEYDRLSNFTFENLKVKAKNADYDKSIIDGLTLKNVYVNKVRIE